VLQLKFAESITLCDFGAMRLAPGEVRAAGCIDVYGYNESDVDKVAVSTWQPRRSTVGQHPKREDRDF